MKPPYRLVSRDHRSQDTQVHVGEVTFGAGMCAVIAGPCAVESRDSLLETATALRGLGVRLLRGGAYKPRTSPYSFRGLGDDGLRVLRDVADTLGMGVVTEVLEVAQVPLVARHADLLQVGTRNMQNFPLLEALGHAGRPILLKRGMSATLEEFLCAAEYVVAAGNPDVILCERGIRSFDPSMRGVMDVNAVAQLKQLTHLPVIVDPSHATGVRQIVRPVGLAGLAAGADGMLVEVHHDPVSSIVDADQTIAPDELRRLLAEANALCSALGRTLQVGERRHSAGVARAGSAA